MYALRMSDVNKEATYLLTYLDALTFRWSIILLEKQANFIAPMSF